MSEKLFKKTRLLLMVVAISLVAMAVLLSGMQDDLSRELPHRNRAGDLGTPRLA